MSIGWGWGWASSCALQAKQGLSQPCAHGTTYAGGNHVVGNHVHSVMGECVDGGNAIYHDEGSSLWHTHDATIQGNYTDTGNYYNGTDITFQPSTVVPDQNWPPAAQAIIDAAGPDTPEPSLVDDDDLRIAYRGSWSSNGSRGFGDLDNGVHYSQQNGASATITFTGSGISFLTETNSDEGHIGVTLDGVAQPSVDATAAVRSAQQKVFSVKGLPSGRHTLTVSKLDGTYFLVDGFQLPR
jgi:hypothetical protein